MTDEQRQDDRAERAFRDALAARGDAAPAGPVVAPAYSGRRGWWVVGLAAASVLAAVAVPLALRGGDERPEAIRDRVPLSSAVPLAAGHRWLGYRDIEVQVPDSWPLDFSPSRPDCARTDGSFEGPDRAYVEIAAPGSGAHVDIGCFPPDPPADMPEEFGVYPFELWVSHVTLADPRDDLAEGSWTYRDWTLTRATVGAVQVTVMESPEDAGLADEVLASARVVELDVNGCPTTSPAQEEEFQVPTTGPVPMSGWEGVIAACQYWRTEAGGAGLVGSRQISGKVARDLVQAINDAPEGGGPDRPGSCSPDSYGDTSVLLRFLPSAGALPDALYPEAFVYVDNCFGNGIVDSRTTRELTQASCRPIFAEPPVTLWMAHGSVWGRCVTPDD